VGTNLQDRYNKTYLHGDIKFYLTDFMPDEEQCRFLILKVLEQAMRDYVSFYDSIIHKEIAFWESAEAFLFDDEYYILWGNLELTIEELLDLVNLDIIWVREQAKKKLKERNNNGAY
jgi:hypothetical protein